MPFSSIRAVRRPAKRLAPILFYFYSAVVPLERCGAISTVALDTPLP